MHSITSRVRSAIFSLSELPVAAVLPALGDALASDGFAVLQAPPGAGKTTLVPLALMEEPWLAGRKIVVLEPRRLAARQAARRMAELLGEPVGERVGYAVRFERRASARTVVEVVTEGLLTRRLQADPELADVGLLVFDEFHERSLDADLALVLALEVQASLRPELRLLLMSATIDPAGLPPPLATAPFIRSDGRLFPVATVHLPPRADEHLVASLERGVRMALADGRGDVLCFLPGASEIRQAAERLGQAFDRSTHAVRPLMGELGTSAQEDALRPDHAGRRKVVLATNIAETSLTIEGVQAVVDSGLVRRLIHSPRTGMSRLQTERISRASADQRRGRAGRLGPGLCIRLWAAPEERGMRPFDPPEITTADLAPLALELAAWGVRKPADLPWPTSPPPASLERAQALLQELGAMDGTGAITPTGRRMVALPLHPRLARVILAGEDLHLLPTAVAVAALLSSRDPWRTTRDPDLAHRLHRWESGDREADKGALAELERVRDQLLSLLPDATHLPSEPALVGRLLAEAYPDRVAQRRPGERGRFRLAQGRGARIAPTEPLAAAEWLAVAELDDEGPEGTIRLAAPLTRDEVERVLHPHLSTRREVVWDEARQRVVAREVTGVGAITLHERLEEPSPADRPGTLLRAALERTGLEQLPWTPKARQLRARLQLLHGHEPARWPSLTDEALLERFDDWLGPELLDASSLAALHRVDLHRALRHLLGPAMVAELDRLLPPDFEGPGGRRHGIDYGRDPPTLQARLQDLFGLGRHPCVLAGSLPLAVELLSPAGRPVQVTRDLPNFWRGSYKEVRKAMRGRYPKHPWPEDPLTATPPPRPARRTG